LNEKRAGAPPAVAAKSDRISSASPVYVAAFERALRPIGSWVTATARRSGPTTAAQPAGSPPVKLRPGGPSRTSVVLPAPEGPAHDRQPARSGSRTSMPAEVVRGGVLDLEPVGLAVSAARRPGWRPAPRSRRRENQRPDGVSAVHSPAGEPSNTTLPPPVTRARPELDRRDPRAATAQRSCSTITDRPAEPRDLGEDPAHLARVEPDRRLVEDVEEVLDRVREEQSDPEPLGLASRQRRRGAVEADVAQARRRRARPGDERPGRPRARHPRELPRPDGARGGRDVVRDQLVERAGRRGDTRRSRPGSPSWKSVGRSGRNPSPQPGRAVPGSSTSGGSPRRRRARCSRARATSSTARRIAATISATWQRP
jgi:hypothetical protein